MLTSESARAGQVACQEFGQRLHLRRPLLQRRRDEVKVTFGLQREQIDAVIITHTPGHIGVRIAVAGRCLVMASNMVFPVVHPQSTNANSLFAQDRMAAQTMRAASSRTRRLKAR